ncbi:MAG: HAD family hydrolase [Campylobacteraceae bacterium]|nr:HAD family hydrolase [Campylobacteraceae bacterium]
MKKSIIFDLDGTLLDSIKDITLSMNKVLEEFGLQTFDIDKYRYFLGGGADILCKNIIKELHVDIAVSTLSERFKQIYDTNLHVNTKPYEGIEEMLERLSHDGHNLAVLSNKPHEMTQKYVEHFFSSYEITQVFGQQKNGVKKPDPSVAVQIAKSFGTNCEEVYFVGDTKVDMQTAKNANMKSIGVLWGFRDEAELRENGADFIVSHPKEIFEIVNQS